MELLSPSFFPVHFAEDYQHSRLEFQDFFFSQFSSAVYLIKYSFDFCIGVIFCIEFFDTVVGQAATLFCEEVMTFAESRNHIVEIGDCHTAYCRQFFYISAEVGRNFYRHCLVRTPGRQHFDFKTAFACLDMIFQRINRIVRSTYYFHVVTTHHSASWVFRLSQLLVTLVVNLACSLRA